MSKEVDKNKLETTRNTHAQNRIDTQCVLRITHAYRRRNVIKAKDDILI